MYASEIHNVSPTVHWEDNANCIYVIEAKIVTPRVKHIAIIVCLIQ